MFLFSCLSLPIHGLTTFFHSTFLHLYSLPFSLCHVSSVNKTIALKHTDLATILTSDYNPPKMEEIYICFLYIFEQRLLINIDYKYSREM